MAEDKVVILGGRGMLGTDLTHACEKRGYDLKVFDLPEFDITSDEQIADVVNQTEIIINCAAYTDVEETENEPDLAYHVNSVAVGQLGKIAKDVGTWVLHISTDFVFDGKLGRPYTEIDTPNPINTYGKTKLAGEQLLAKSGCHYCIVRVEWIYGLHGSNFVTKLIKRAKADKNIHVVDDQIGSPTATTEVAEAICELLRRKPKGLFHFAASGYATRFEVARFIFDELGMSVKLNACKSSDYVTAAARPLNSRFDCSKIQALLYKPIKPWQIPLKKFVEEL